MLLGGLHIMLVIGANMQPTTYNLQQKPTPHNLSPFFRLIPRHKSPAARTEQKPEVVPPTAVVDCVNGYFVVKQTGYKAERGNEAVY